MKPDEANNPGDVPRDRFPWGCLIALLVVFFPIYKIVSPSDWVTVTVGPFPKRHFADDRLPNGSFCLLAEDSTGTVALQWYHAKGFPFTFDPLWFDPVWGQSLGDGFEGTCYDEKPTSIDVQWRSARMYGVLVRWQDGQWQLWWLGPGDLQGPSVLRYILSGGTANIHLPAEDRAEVPSKEFLKQLEHFQ